MEEEDYIFLQKSLENNTNNSIKNLTYLKINNMKRDVIEELNLTKNDSNELLKKLKDYRYIDEYPELVEGRYIRWIPLDNSDEIKLNNGGILCEIKVDDFITLVLKNNTNRFFQINLDENLVFQKLSDQEKIILYAIDLIDN